MCEGLKVKPDHEVCQYVKSVGLVYSWLPPSANSSKAHPEVHSLYA